jgi:TIR domain
LLFSDDGRRCGPRVPTWRTAYRLRLPACEPGRRHEFSPNAQKRGGSQDGLHQSHTSEDADLADDIGRELSRAGLDVWDPRDAIPVGASVWRGIEEGLASSDTAIVVLSRGFEHAPWAEMELAALIAAQSTRRCGPDSARSEQRNDAHAGKTDAFHAFLLRRPGCRASPGFPTPPDALEAELRHANGDRPDSRRDVREGAARDGSSIYPGPRESSHPAYFEIRKIRK